MKTVLEAILDLAEVDSNTAKMTVKDAMLQEADDAHLVLGKGGKVYIKSGRKTLGHGKTVCQAWENAFLNAIQYRMS